MMEQKPLQKLTVDYPEKHKELILAEREAKTSLEKQYQEETKHLATFAEYRYLKDVDYLLKQIGTEPYGISIPGKSMYNVNGLKFESNRDLFAFTGELAHTTPIAKQACLDQADKNPNIKIHNWNPWGPDYRKTKKANPQFQITRY